MITLCRLLNPRRLSRNVKYEKWQGNLAQKTLGNFNFVINKQSRGLKVTTECEKCNSLKKVHYFPIIV